MCKTWKKIPKLKNVFLRKGLSHRPNLSAPILHPVSGSYNFATYRTNEVLAAQIILPSEFEF